MTGTINEIRDLLKDAPDIPNKRRILTKLSDLNEQLNIIFGIVAGAQGYTFDAGLSGRLQRREAGNKDKAERVGEDGMPEPHLPLRR